MEADVNEGKLGKVKNNPGVSWAETYEIDANTLINRLVMIKAKSVVSINTKITFD